MPPIEAAIKCVGSQSALAAALDIKQPTVSEWVRHQRPVPHSLCPSIERATKGAVTCEQLRPDLSWARIADKSWAADKRGRPVLDVTKVAARHE